MQVVVTEVVGHNPVSSYQGRKKTKDRVWREFWWPGFGADVTKKI